LPNGFFSDQKTPDLGTFWRTLAWIMLLYILVIWNILQPLGIIGILWAFGNFEVIWYIFPCFGILYQEKSGTLLLNRKTKSSLANQG
jgi:hypothetical protein